jgi:hypothetical protein
LISGSELVKACTEHLVRSVDGRSQSEKSKCTYGSGSIIVAAQKRNRAWIARLMHGCWLGWAGGGDTTVAYTANATLKASNRALVSCSVCACVCVCVCERERERRNVLKMAFGNFCVSTSYQSMTGGMMMHATYGVYSTG